MITKMETKNGTIVLHFDSDVGSVDSQAIAGFAIAGEDKKYEPARAEPLVTGNDGRGQPLYDRKTLILDSPYVAKPIHFRYAWGRNPMGNLRIANTKGKDIPFPTQRSDNWEFWEVPYVACPSIGEHPVALWIRSARPCNSSTSNAASTMPNARSRLKSLVTRS